MIKDRGNIKWTSLMLPEHVKLLKELWEEEDKVPRPIIDEHMGEIIEKKILNSYQMNQIICVKYFCNGKINYIKDCVVKIDQTRKEIQFKNGRTLSNKDIVSVS